MSFYNYNEKPLIDIWEGITAKFIHTENMSHGRLYVEAGSSVPEHAHPHEQWTHVLEGELELIIDGKSTILKPGMMGHMPSNVPHSAIAHTDCKLLECFNPVREDIKEKENS